MDPRVTTITTESIVNSSRYFFYTSISAFLIFLIMFFIHYFFVPFLPSMFPSKLIVTNNNTNTNVSYDSISLYANTAAASNTKMNFTPNITNISTNNFTLSFDCFLNGTYKSTDVPRVLFYFGASPISSINNINFKEYKGSSEGETPMVLDSTNSDLLNKITGSNFVIYVDPVKNDMKIGIYTVDTASPPKTRVEIASIIKNIPINKTFKVTMVLTSNFVEVYMNKKLVNTYKVGSLSPTTAALSPVTGTNYGIYTPIDFIGNTIKVGRIQFYNGPLTSIQIRNLIPDVAPNTFFNPG